MRARAGDPPRTMAQKILAGRCADPHALGGPRSGQGRPDRPCARAARALAEAREAGLKKTSAEVAIVYDTHCDHLDVRTRTATEEMHAATRDVLAHGIVIARPGIGFPGARAPRALREPGPPLRDRRAAPRERRRHRHAHARRLARHARRRRSRQGTIVAAAAAQRAGAPLRPHAPVRLRARRRARAGPPRPRRGRARASRPQHAAPVVLEFAGPSARLLSVGERAVLAGIAPQLGAAGALFVSDEKTEVFLRDQRRSKAHRALVPDAGRAVRGGPQRRSRRRRPALMDETGAGAAGARSRGQAGHAGRPRRRLRRDAARPLRRGGAAQVEARPAAPRVPRRRSRRARCSRCSRQRARSSISSRPARASSSPTRA